MNIGSDKRKFCFSPGLKIKVTVGIKMKVTVGIVSRCEQELTVAIFNRCKQTWLLGLISLENATSLFNRS